MKQKTQVLIIHGGMTFKNKKDYLRYLHTCEVSFETKSKWSDQYMIRALGRNYIVKKPRMPLSDNAQYADWKIFFERFIPLLQKNSILIGNSLGGMFLAKYLAENKLPKKALSVYLVCPPFDNDLPDGDLAGGFGLPSDLSQLQNNAKNVYFLFSQDDDVVPIAHAEKYKKKLPTAEYIIFESKNGHFKVSEFPEIVRMIKQDVRNQ